MKQYVGKEKHIGLSDSLVSRDFFGPDDVSYFAAEITQKFRLTQISNEEWANVLTVKDLIDLIEKHLP